MAKGKPKQIEGVLEMVRAELAKNPDISSGDLFAMARKMNRSVRSLSLRQFHALYPLQVKRAEKAAQRAAGKRAASVSRPQARSAKRVAGAADRAAIRGLLVEFAAAVASAESKADVIHLVGDFDQWVDRVMAATG